MTRLHLVLQDPSKIQQKAMQSMFDCFEGLCEGTVIVDRDARVVWINDRYAARLGILVETGMNSICPSSASFDQNLPDPAGFPHLGHRV